MTKDREIYCLFERKDKFAQYESTTCIREIKKNNIKCSSTPISDSRNRKSDKEQSVQQCAGDNGINVNVDKKKVIKRHSRLKYKIFKFTHSKEGIHLIKSISREEEITKYGRTLNCSNSIFKKNTKHLQGADIIISRKSNPFQSFFIVGNCCRSCDKPECCNPFINPSVLANIYRCQLSSKEDTCCCTCNSDAMFEVMKSLYDCYKRKNCDRCECILCGGVCKTGPHDEKEAGLTKRLSEKMREAKAAGLLDSLEEKTTNEKEQIIKTLAKLGVPLPKAKTPSEQKLIDGVRKEFGLPPEPKTSAERAKMDKLYADGVITTMDNKTPSQKLKVLQKMKDAGIVLPEGRTPTEKALVDQVMFTDLAKSDKEKKLRELAMQGKPLPDGATASDKKLISKVRFDMGLPPMPKTASKKAKLNKAVIEPLEGKTADQKKEILKKLAEQGIELPKGRTPSEQKVIDSFKKEHKQAKSSSEQLLEMGIPKEKIRKAEAEGLLTPIEGKTPEEKEKILKGLAKAGIPLPEGKTDSEKKLINKVRHDLGMPPEPKTTSQKIKLAKTYADGLVEPLGDKSPKEKEKLLKNLALAGVPLPVGRTPSEQALIDKVKKEVPPKEILDKARTEGLLTPLQGKTPEQKDKILKELAKLGMPLPEAKTPSEQKLIDKVRKEVGLPPEPKTTSEKLKLAQTYADGVVEPLGDKTPKEKEKILKKLAVAGVPLPVGRTPSEQALIDKVKNETPAPPKALLDKAKAEGLLTPLQGKTSEQKEKILKGLAKVGMPLPEAKTPSEQKLMDKVRQEVGLPPEPKTTSQKLKLAQTYADGVVEPLGDKPPKEKEKILRKLALAGAPLPVGRTPTEQALIDKVKKEIPALPKEVLDKAKAEGLFTPLPGKTPEQKEKILKALARAGIPLPEPKTPSEQKLIDKVRKDLGMPPEPKTTSQKIKMAKSYADGIVEPLDDKPPKEKEKILRKLAQTGTPLPVGRTPSEQALIDKVLKESPTPPKEILDKAKAEGLLTPLQGKTPEQKEKILKGLARAGIPLLEPKTPSEQKLIDKVRKELGLPPEPKTTSEKIKMAKSYADGIVEPLDVKSPKEKEKILRKLAQAGIPLPVGRTPSEQALIDNVIKESPAPPKEILDKAKAEGLLTPLQGKTPEQKEKIIKGLAKVGMPLPEAKTPSEQKLMDKVRKEIGLPPEPKTTSEKIKLAKSYADGLVEPLGDKTPKEKEKILKNLALAGAPLPVGRTPSEQALIDKVKKEIPPKEILDKARAEGLLTPLEGKTPDQKQKILKGLASAGIPLPEPKTISDQKLLDKVRHDLGMPPEPKTTSEKLKMGKSYAAGIVEPLGDKSPKEKEKILKNLALAGVPLPVGRTPSEQALIDKVKQATPAPPKELLDKARAEGLLTPLQGKTPDQKEKILKGLAKVGLPLPEAKTPSEQKLMDKVRQEVGLPPEPKTTSQKLKLAKTYADGVVEPLGDKNPKEKEKILRKLALAGAPLPVGRTPTEQALIDKVKKEIPEPPKQVLDKARAEGLLTPLQGKTPEQKEKILTGLAKAGLPLPEAKTPSEQKQIDKVRQELGLPPEPKTTSQKIKLAKTYADGLVEPLGDKSPKEKEKLLKNLALAGVPLPVGRTPSEQALIDKVKKELPPKEILDKARAEGLLTPLQGKTPQQKDKILKGLAQAGIPLPEAKTPSEQKQLDKVRQDLGLPPEKSKGTLSSQLKEKGLPSEKIRKAKAEGLLTPLEGKTPEQKEKILTGLAKRGLPLPEAKTPSEQKLTDKVRHELGLPPEPKTTSQKSKLAKSYADGLVEPLGDKSPKEKEKVLRKLALAGAPLPVGRTPSEKALIDKVKKELPPKEVLEKARTEGLLTPLQGKTPEQKDKILKELAKLGIPLPEAKSPSEQKQIDKVRQDLGLPLEKSRGTLSTQLKEKGVPSEKIRKAKAEGLLTSLDGKTPEEKEQLLKKLAKAGLPLPEGKTELDQKLNDKVRRDLGLPPEPKTISDKIKMAKTQAAGLIEPLEDKSPKEKEKILRNLALAGVPLPVGRTPSEQALIDKVKKESPPKELLDKARAEGLLTPLQGKTPEQKSKILKGLAKVGLPLPEAKTPSEQKVMDKVRQELGLPPEPKTTSQKIKLAKTYADGLVEPLGDKPPKEKEKILRKLALAGAPLPVGRTPTEQALIDKVKKETPAPPKELLDKAKAEGLLTPLQGKTPEQKGKILTGLAKIGMPLPEAKTPSEQKLMDKVRKDLGLPPEPKTTSQKIKLAKSYADGLVEPLGDKSPKEKEKILKKLALAGAPLPVGRTPTEQALIDKVKKETRPISKEKLDKARAEGLLTPLQGKTPEQKEKILQGLAKQGLPLPEAKTPSEQKQIDKVRQELGLPPEPKTTSQKIKLAKTYADGLVEPLGDKSPKEKEKLLKNLALAGVPLPVGRTPSEQALIDKVKKEVPPKEILDKARAEGLLTPLQGKTPEQKDKILKELAKLGIPLPEAKTPSEQKLIDKVRQDLGLPPDKSKGTLSTQLKEKGVPSEKIRKAKAEGLLTTLDGKTPEDKEQLLRKLAKAGLPLPEGKTELDQKLNDKVRRDLGLPPEPKTVSDKIKMAKTYADGIVEPLDEKSPKEKEKILKKLAIAGIPLPVGRTPSEKDLIAKVKNETRPMPKEKIDKAKAEGLLTPLQGKPPEQKEKILKGLARAGIPLPDPKTPSEQKLTDKVRKELGLPPEPKTTSQKIKMAKSYADGIVEPLDEKPPKEKEKILRKLLHDGIPLPVGRTPSEQALIDKVLKESPAPPKEILDKAKAEGLLTPLQGKTPEQKEKILTGLAKIGMPLPEAKTPSEQKIMDKVRKELGLPPEPKTTSEKIKLAKSYADGLVEPLGDKTPKEKEKVLKKLALAGAPLPVGRTPSEQALIDKVKKETPAPPKEILDKAKAEGLLTPLQGKTPEQKEKILKGLGNAGLPLPEPKTLSEAKLIDKVRREIGLPPEPKTTSEKLKMGKSYAAGIVEPLGDKSPKEKEKILKNLAIAGVPLPVGRTPSEQVLIDKVKKELPPKEILDKAKAAGLLTPLQGKTPEQKEKILKGLAKAGIPLPEVKTPSEQKILDKVRKDLGLPPEKASKSKGTLSDKMRKAKADGLLTPLEGKKPEEKEKILQKLAKAGIPLPEGKTDSEKKLINKVRQDLGLPPEPKTTSEKLKLDKSFADGLVEPLGDKSPKEKEKILKKLALAGAPLPVGRTPSEQALIEKVKRETPPKEILDKARAEGLLTPLQGKTPDQKEKILKGLAKAGIPLPDTKSPSEQKLMDKVRKELGLPPEPKTTSEKFKLAKSYADGLVEPLGDKSPKEKEKILRKLALAGAPLPVGRTPSEQALIDKVKKETPAPPKELLDKAKAEGLLTPLQGKTPEQKEKILKGLAKQGLPLPEAKTPSDQKLMDKVRKEVGLPPEPKTTSEKIKLAKSYADGLVEPLGDKSPKEKEKILKKLALAGVPLPVGRTPSEQALIDNVKREVPPKEVLDKARAEGLLTPLQGKTPQQKEKILKGLAQAGIPLPEAKTSSEQKVLDKVRQDLGLPPEKASKLKRTLSEIMGKAKADGLLTPLEGKKPEEKEKILKNLAKTGIPLPEGKTDSEKDLIAKVRQDLGMPPEPKTQSQKDKMAKSYAAGVIEPLDNKSDAEKEKILNKMLNAGIELPVGRTASEKALIDKVKKGGLGAEIMEIKKTTKCDRGCGCDKKKIKFKHSYVKIRVTSPDISSLCNCPYECIPGVKGGIFVDNEGIKVTIGRATGVPRFVPSTCGASPEPTRKFKKILGSSQYGGSFYCNSTYDSSKDDINSVFRKYHSNTSFFKIRNKSFDAILNASESYPNQKYCCTSQSINYSELLHSSCKLNDGNRISTTVDSSQLIGNKSSTRKTLSEYSSYDSIILLRTGTSFSDASCISEFATISIISFVESSISSLTENLNVKSGFHNLNYRSEEHLDSRIHLLENKSKASSAITIQEYLSEDSHFDPQTNKDIIVNDGLAIFRFSGSFIRRRYGKEKKKVVINDEGAENIMETVAQNMLQDKSDNSSVFLVVPSTDISSTTGFITEESRIAIVKSNPFGSFPSVSADHHLPIASRGVKLACKAKGPNFKENMEQETKKPLESRAVTETSKKYIDLAYNASRKIRTETSAHMKQINKLKNQEVLSGKQYATDTEEPIQNQNHLTEKKTELLGNKPTKSPTFVGIRVDYFPSAHKRAHNKNQILPDEYNQDQYEYQQSADQPVHIQNQLPPSEFTQHQYQAPGSKPAHNLNQLLSDKGNQNQYQLPANNPAHNQNQFLPDDCNQNHYQLSENKRAHNQRQVLSEEYNQNHQWSANRRAHNQNPFFLDECNQDQYQISANNPAHIQTQFLPDECSQNQYQRLAHSRAHCQNQFLPDECYQDHYEISANQRSYYNENQLLPDECNLKHYQSSANKRVQNENRLLPNEYCQIQHTSRECNTCHNQILQKEYFTKQDPNPPIRNRNINNQYQRLKDEACVQTRYQEYMADPNSRNQYKQFANEDYVNYRHSSCVGTDESQYRYSDHFNIHREYQPMKTLEPKHLYKEVECQTSSRHLYNEPECQNSSKYIHPFCHENRSQPLTRENHQNMCQLLTRDVSVQNLHHRDLNQYIPHSRQRHVVDECCGEQYQFYENTVQSPSDWYIRNTENYVPCPQPCHGALFLPYSEFAANMEDEEEYSQSQSPQYSFMSETNVMRCKKQEEDDIRHIAHSRRGPCIPPPPNVKLAPPLIEPGVCRPCPHGSGCVACGKRKFEEIYCNDCCQERLQKCDLSEVCESCQRQGRDRPQIGIKFSNLKHSKEHAVGNDALAGCCCNVNEASITNEWEKYKYRTKMMSSFKKLPRFQPNICDPKENLEMLTKECHIIKTNTKQFLKQRDMDVRNRDPPVVPIAQPCQDQQSVTRSDMDMNSGHTYTKGLSLKKIERKNNLFDETNVSHAEATCEGRDLNFGGFDPQAFSRTVAMLDEIESELQNARNGCCDTSCSHNQSGTCGKPKSVLNVHVTGSRYRHTKPSTPCECRTISLKAEKDCPPKECVCPEDCLCPQPKLPPEPPNKPGSVALQQMSETAQVESGFKMFQRRRGGLETITWEEAIYLLNLPEEELPQPQYVKHFVSSGLKCPGCGDENCPGTWIFNPPPENPLDANSAGCSVGKAIHVYTSENPNSKRRKILRYLLAHRPQSGRANLQQLSLIIADAEAAIAMEKKTEHECCTCEPKRDIDRTMAACTTNEHNALCSCHGQTKGKEMLCDCPPGGGKSNFEHSGQYAITPEIEIFGTGNDGGPFGGVKFEIPAKGSASRALEGVCCFNMSLENSDSDSSGNISTYLMYTN